MSDTTVADTVLTFGAANPPGRVMTADPPAASADILSRLDAAEALLAKWAPIVEAHANAVATEAGVPGTIMTRIEAAEAAIEKWAPMVEGLISAGLSADRQGASLLTILGHTAAQAFGIKL